MAARKMFAAYGFVGLHPFVNSLLVQASTGPWPSEKFTPKSKILPTVP